MPVFYATDRRYTAARAHTVMTAISGCLLALLMAFLMTPIGANRAHAVVFDTGEIVQYDQDTFLIGATTQLKVRVRNTGKPDNFTLKVVGKPTGWTVTPTSNTAFLRGGDEKDFALQVTPGSGATESKIDFELWGTQTGTFLDIRLDSGFAPVKSVFGPQPFAIVSPAAGTIEVSTWPKFQWESSDNATRYVVYLFEDVDGAPSSTLLWASSPVVGTSVTYNGTRLGFEKGYWWTVDAINDYGTLRNSEGLTLFRTEPVPVPGAFSITSPVANATYPTAPTIAWSTASNASHYIVEVYEDVGGKPGAAPVRTSPQIKGNSWSYGGNPPPLGRYYYTFVTAFSADGGARSASNTGVRAHYTALSGFNLLTPGNLDSFESLNPSFTWQAVSGATGYRLEIRGNQPINAGYKWSKVFSSSSGTYDGTPLLDNARYTWQVYALATGEERASTNGPWELQTIPLRPFESLSPQYLEYPVDFTPTFSWQAVKNATHYYVQVARVDPTAEGGMVEVYHSLVSAPNTTKVWDGAIPLQPGQTYVWRVTAYYFTSNKGRVNEGGWKLFYTRNVGNFQLSSPAFGATGVSTTPRFQWTASERCTSYRIVLWRQNADSSLSPTPTSYIDVPGTSPDGPVTSYVYDARPALTGNTRYYWQVYAAEYDSFFKSLSDGFSFVTAPSSAVDTEGVREAVLGQGTPDASALPAVDKNDDSVLDASDYLVRRAADASGS